MFQVGTRLKWIGGPPTRAMNSVCHPSLHYGYRISEIQPKDSITGDPTAVFAWVSGYDEKGTAVGSWRWVSEKEWEVLEVAEDPRERRAYQLPYDNSHCSNSECKFRHMCMRFLDTVLAPGETPYRVVWTAFKPGEDTCESLKKVDQHHE